ncbi:chorismate-binding protein [Ekhidna sp.]|uniref:chorismate-binding protein n=1 Tax=Ekhidna sp. TaxID=2608089 RepID=UPI0032983599
MIEIQKALDLLQKDQLIKKLELAGYAFAAWRMPNTSQTQLIISLSDIDKLKEFHLSKLHSGFLINEFIDNHPVQPHFISADIVIRNDELLIDPRVKSSQIDRFKEDLADTCVSSDSDSKSPFHTKSNDFEQAVEDAVLQIKAGKFEKIVLSRFKDEKLPANFSPWTFFQSIATKYTNGFINMTFVPGKGLWIGATPELLLSSNKEEFRTVSLAGTKTLEEGQNLSEIAWTQKEIEEQAFVSRYIINCFKKIRLREFHEHGPKTIQAGNLAHLKTEFIVDYKEVAFENLADQMLELLHPTSAVCGMPIEHTKPWIADVENYDREFYSGFLGPVNFDGSTNLFVNLRCMKVANDIIRFYAGAGITEDSVSDKEFLETEIKMDVLMSMLT